MNKPASASTDALIGKKPTKSNTMKKTTILLAVTAMLAANIFAASQQNSNLLYTVNFIGAIPLIFLAFIGSKRSAVWQIHSGDKIIVEEEMPEPDEIEIENFQKSKTARAGLNTERIGEIVTKITVLMEHEKLYQEIELTLQQLADKLESPTYLVSQALNEGMKKSFYDAVNGYRVEEAKRLLLDAKSKNFTILSVGFEAGFNSKTTFNTVFKKFTGLTPTEFRNKKLQLSLAA